MLFIEKNADGHFDLVNPDARAEAGTLHTFLVVVEHRAVVSTVPMPVVKDEFEVTAPTLLEACLAVVDGRDKDKANVVRRRTHDPYTREYVRPSYAKLSGVAGIVENDVASVRRAVVNAGHGYERESLAAIRRLGASFADKDGDNLIAAVQDDEGEPAELVSRLRTFAETVWVDEERKGLAYDQDMVDRLKSLGFGSEAELSVAREAYWTQTTQVVAEAFARHHQSASPGM